MAAADTAKEMSDHDDSHYERPGFFERLISNPGAIAAILAAIAGQAVFSIIFQITNNEQQEARITANAQALTDFKSAVNNLQTPLSGHVIKIEGEIIDIRKAIDEFAKRMDTVDVAGTRALALVAANQQRETTQVDRLAERIIMQDRKVTELEGKVTNPVMQARIEEVNRNVGRLEDQQRRIIQALDNLYSQVSKIPPALRADPPKDQ